MTYTIHNESILDYCARYDGPLYHALLCDAPYHLTSIVNRFGAEDAAPAQPGTDGAFGRLSKGFMGKSWDGGDLAFRPETWAAMGRLLHPGAFGMAFASSRGWHRMAVAIEDAGFIIHPTIFCWTFGCLSDDTEILTADGWQPYHKAIKGTTVACYNIDTDGIEWHAVQELVTYDYNETAYRIQSDDTDQLVSRNHRCIVERNGRYTFELAERLAPAEVVPVLQNLSGLRSAVRRDGLRSIPQKADLLKGLRSGGIQPQAQGDQNGAAQKAAQENGPGGSQGQHLDLSGMRGGVLATSGLDTQERAAVLLQGVPSENCNHAQPDRQPLRSNRPEVSGYGAQGRQESGMEGRRNVFQEARELYRGEVCSVSGGVSADGAQGRVHYGASPDRSPGHRPAAPALRGGTSYRPQPGQQRLEQPPVVCEQSRPQTLRASRITAASLAAVTPVHYQGIVWCVRVPTGAFVARRNGKVFVTGNSGFPKATRIDTQVDRAAGAERQVVGEKKHAPKFAAAEMGYREKDNGYNSRDRASFDLTAPATELAQAWEGHRYGLQAMKPAIEPIIVFQRPYQGRPVDCITRTGAGALNIDAGRIPAEGRPLRQSLRGESLNTFGDGLNGSYADGETDLGRWPANFVAVHTPWCDDAGCAEGCPVASLDAQSGTAASKESFGIRSSKDIGTYGAFQGQDEALKTYGDEGGASRFFLTPDWNAEVAEGLLSRDPVRYVAKASQAERESGLGGDPTTIGDGRQTPIDNAYQRGKTERRNTHPTIKPIALNRWLASLLLPPAYYAPGRRLLVPFSGAGSEMIGAVHAGWDHIDGVELEAEYVALAEQRLRYWSGAAMPAPIKRTAVPTGQISMLEAA